MRTALREAEERGDELDDDQGNQHAEEAAGEEEEEEEEEVFCVADAILLRDVAILLRDVAPKDVPPRAVLPPRDERAGIGLDVRGCIA